ncbi:hypothetical protein ACFY0B_44970 [Streptomyces sp. NPDC001797]|uniref:hypothetical protein n=1 Tax=Streptomyces sp. NPDC001797 TaxID=3364610 RepID=UPI0036D0F1CD
MTVNDGLAPLTVALALRVLLPDLQVGSRRLLHAAVQVGVTELLQARPDRPVETLAPSSAASRDGEA